MFLTHSFGDRREMDTSEEEMSVNSRKIRKPLMERKRRARINHSLEELHHLLTENDFTSKGTKLEKADILEMTVQYLKQVQQSEWRKEREENLENGLRERYLLGFEKCVEEMERLLAESPEVDFHLGRKLRGHLRAGLERARRGSWRASVVVGGTRDLRILPSQLPNGDVVLLLSSGGDVKCDESLKKSVMWRPWW